VVIAAGWVAAPAAAQRLPDDNSGTGQYIEPVPDAEGDRPANPGGGGDRGGSGGGGSDSGGLPPSVRDDLPPGAEGRVLERLATDPGSGAQPGVGGRSGGGDGAGGSDRGRSSRGGPAGDELGGDGSAASALSSAVTGDDGPAIPLLVGGLLLLTLAAAGIRLRSSRP
jgi:hypothetical protein